MVVKYGDRDRLAGFYVPDLNAYLAGAVVTDVNGLAYSAINPFPVTVGSSPAIAAFKPTGEATLSVTTTSARVALGSAGPTAFIVNTGANVAYVVFGNSSVLATTTLGHPIPSGWGITFDIGSATYIAAITASSTASLTISTGTGNPSLAASGSASSTGEAVNLTSVGGNLLVADDSAAGTTAPVPGGGIYQVTMPTYSDLDRTQFQFTTRGLLKTLTSFIAGNANGSDGLANSNQAQLNDSATLVNAGLFLPVWNYFFNGTTWDRVRSGGVTGMAGVTPQATPSGAASFLNIAAGQATTTVKSGAGTLYAIILNSAATATSTMIVYDNTAASGTVIGRPLATTATIPTTVDYGPVGLAFSTGLTIITATANGSDMTVVYK